MNTRRFFIMVMALAFFTTSGQFADAQEEYRDLCTSFWKNWAAGEVNAYVALAATPFLYCDGKLISEIKDNEELPIRLKSLRNSSKIGAEISVNIKNEFSFEKLPIDSFRLSDDAKAKFREFFLDDDVVIYAELKDMDGEKRDMFVLVVRWCKGEPKAVGIFD